MHTETTPTVTVQTRNGGAVQMRQPAPEDGPALWALARHNGLDLNSRYAYLLQGAHFSDTCVVAADGRAIVGFVTAYRPPTRPDAIFVWQVAVRADARGRGLASLMLHRVLTRPACRDARYLEATVTPSNAASQRLFRGVARRLGVECRESEFFPRALFGAGDHEAEDLFRIGPLPADRSGGLL